MDQLSGHGLIVVPLRMKGVTRSIAFERDGKGLVSRNYRLSGFVPMQGSGSFDERLVPLGDGVALRVDDPAQRFDARALGEALDAPRWRSGRGRPSTCRTSWSCSCSPAVPTS